MRWKDILVVFVVTTSIQFVYCQVDEKINKLKAPTSPASIVIGNQPATISRPKSWQALEASVYSNYFNSSGNVVVPNDFAIEFMPYWSSNKRYIPIEDVASPSPMHSLLQNLSLSVSSTKNYIIKDSVKTDALGFGVRTVLWVGTKDQIEADLEIVMKIREGLALCAQVVAMDGALRNASTNPNNDKDKFDYKTKTEYINKLMVKIKTNVTQDKDVLKWFKNYLNQNLPKGDRIDYTEALDSACENLSELDINTLALENLIKERGQGFKLEIAGALALNFPTNKTDFSYVPKYSVWLTPSFQPHNSENFEFLGVLRYNWLNRSFYEYYSTDNNFFDNNFDYGLRFVYKKEKFSVELETVGRTSNTILEKSIDSNGIKTVKTKTDTDFQYILNFNFRISENIILSYNFGKQFQPVLNYDGNLISMATLNFGIGGPKKSDVKE